jgi:oligoendopeptidase F
MPSSSQSPSGKSPRAEAKFLVEATSTRNENLTTELTAEDSREAEQRAILDFMCEGHGVLEVTVSEMKENEK